jgi:hypothetical protein
MRGWTALPCGGMERACVMGPGRWRDAAAGAWWRLHPRGVRSRRRLAALRDRHRGQRCFILGNGPSLADMDLSPLRSEVTFAMNRGYLLFPRLGFESTYFTCVNRLVLEQFGGDIDGLGMPRFVSWPGRRFVRDATFVRCFWREPVGFSMDPRRGLWLGATVTYFTLQLAYFMGFETVVLIGVDHHFTTRGRPNEVVTLDGADPNHFAGEYFGRGLRWQLPDLEASERAYRLARQRFEADGRRVIDATVGGRLTVFEKAAYDSLF